MNHNEYSYRGSNRGSHYDRRDSSHRGAYRGRGGYRGKPTDHYNSSYRGRGGFRPDRNHGRRDRDAYDSSERDSPRYQHSDARRERYEDRGERYEDRGERYEERGERYEERGERYEERGERYEERRERYDERNRDGDGDRHRDRPRDRSRRGDRNREIGSREIGAREIGAREIASREIASRETASREIASREIASRDRAYDRDENDYRSRRDEDMARKLNLAPSDKGRSDRTEADTDVKARPDLRPDSARKLSSPTGSEIPKPPSVYTNPWISILKLGEGRTAARVEASYKEMSKVNDDISKLQEDRVRLGNAVALLDIYACRDALNAELCTEKLDEFSYL